MGQYMFKRHVREFWPERDFKKYPVWFVDFSHSYPAWTPLFEWTWVYNLLHGHIYGCNEAWIPETRSSDWREMDGMALCTATPVPNKEEVEFRRKKFYEFIKNDFEPNYDQKWDKSKQEMIGRYNVLKEFDYENATFYELYKQFNLAIETHKRMWEDHFFFMYALYGAYWYFEDLCKEYVGIKETSTEWHRLVRGYDNMLFRMDKVMWELRNKAIEYGIDDIIFNNPSANVIEELNKTPQGKKWVDVDLYQFMQGLEYGWRMIRMMEFVEPTWWEAPENAILHIKQYLLVDREIKPFPLDAIREKLIKERDEAEKAIVAKAEAGGCKDMEWFKCLMRLAQRTSSFSESHDFLYEHRCFSAFRFCMLKIGERLAKVGTFNEASDIFFFIPEELRTMIAMPENYESGFIARERRMEWLRSKEFLSRPPIIPRDQNMTPPEAGAFMAAAKDPIIAKITIGEFNPPDLSLGALCYGNPGSPGVAEGPACIVITAADLKKLRPGDIMVCPSSQSAYTPVFPLIKGLVCNGGGSLSHGPIVGREWDIPVVANCITGTQLIKDGDRIKVDGFRGLVFKL
ncbi:MAG: Chondramide synthase cmdD [Syntrophorhabdus sp. PtaU1.Bin050]|nr:MAG: Chondramide synthase cmdD [Syntrophorhabdus sp. PtaU1.Bin050]